MLPLLKRNVEDTKQFLTYLFAVCYSDFMTPLAEFGHPLKQCQAPREGAGGRAQNDKLSKIRPDLLGVV
jgi:hypothetical protein